MTREEPRLAAQPDLDGAPTDTSFVRSSYQRHAEHFEQYGVGGERAERMRSWMREDTIDAWRHRRMFRFLDPLIETVPDAKWLTIGDGALAGDARYLHRKGVDVLATDISNTLGDLAIANGYIKRFQQENAEALSFGDGSFDFVLCKESYHHFPRPWLAVYEMLRVARVGVVLIEPFDFTDRRSGLQTIFGLVNRIRRAVLRRPAIVAFEFEETGNFKYPLSRDETIKVALGLNLRQVAFAGLDDRFEEGFNDALAKPSDPVFRSVARALRLRALLVRLGLTRPAVLVAAIFVRPIIDTERRALIRAGYEVVDLPRNPYGDGT